MPAAGATGAATRTIRWPEAEPGYRPIGWSALPRLGYLAAEAPLAGTIGYGVMDVGADEGTTVPIEPLALALVSGAVVVTDGAVLAGVAAEGGMALVFGLVLVFSFLPQAPSASSTEKATTVAARRVFGNIKRIKNFLEVIDHWRQQKIGNLGGRPENLLKKSVHSASNHRGNAQR